MRNHWPAPLPLPGFFFERAAIFTSAAENIGNLWNEACKHGLEAICRTHTYTLHNIVNKPLQHKPATNDTGKARRCDTSPTLTWPSIPVPVLPLAGLFVVCSGVLAA